MTLDLTEEQAAWLFTVLSYLQADNLQEVEDLRELIAILTSESTELANETLTRIDQLDLAITETSVILEKLNTLLKVEEPKELSHQIPPWEIEL